MLDYTSKSVAPIEDDHTRLNTAMLLENQEQWCIREAGPNYAPSSAGINRAGNPGAVGNAVLIALETNPAAIAPATTPNASCNGNFEVDILRRAILLI